MPMAASIHMLVFRIPISVLWPVHYSLSPRVQECSRLREEAKKLRNDNSTLYNGTQEHEKSLTRLRTQLAILEQELKAKEQVR